MSCDLELGVSLVTEKENVSGRHTAVVNVQLVALWERFVLTNQSKVSVTIGSFSVPVVLTHFSA